MIILSRLNGQEFALNCDLIERADKTPDTVITLVDGTKYVVTESLEEVVNRIRAYRASILSAADTITTAPERRPHLEIVAPVEDD